MKKLFSLAMAFCLCAAVNAQAETEKYYGAEKGSFAVSIDAMPFVNYAGNFFGKTEANSFDLDAISGEIAAKYFLTDKFALAANFSINNEKTTDFAYLYEYYSDFSDIIGKNSEVSKTFQLGIGAQYYFRPGKRLQPFVGANVFIGRNNIYVLTKDYSYTFKPEGAEEPLKGYDTTSKYGDAYFEGEELILDAYAPSTTFGVAANLGIELFLSKNISVSTAIDLGVKTTSTRNILKFKSDNKDAFPKDIQETMNYNMKVKNKTEFATGLMGGNLSLNFYF